VSVRAASAGRAQAALEAARERLLALAERAPATLGPEPAWLSERRRRAREQFAEVGLPSTRLEDWRYTNLAPLAGLELELPPLPGREVSREALERVCFPVFACSLYVFVDGRFRADLSSPRALSGALRVESLAELRAGAQGRLPDPLDALVDAKQHPFAALATALLDDGALLRVPRGARLEQPVHVVFASSGAAPALVHPRLLVVAEPGSSVQVIQDHVSLGPAAGFANCVSEVLVGQDARVDLVLLQREAAGAFLVSNLAVRQERDSSFSAHTLTLGGRLVRNDACVLLADQGAECRLNGLFVGAGESLIDNHTCVDHAMPHGTSRELYKGILGGRSRGVFRGRVLVRPDAQKTDAAQSNANLLVSEGAQIDTKPQLEIHADDVRCSHGSATGQLDPEALFYLRSRGVAERDARHLLTRGFAREVLDALPVPALVEGLDEALLARLSEATGAEA
jgi:Fe-S cluster assembly protein SufD